MFITTATVGVHLDRLPDAAISEIAAEHKLTGDRAALIDKLRNIMHGLTMAQLDLMFANIKTVADKYGVPDAIKYHT